jgi:hypothetical protein
MIDMATRWTAARQLFGVSYNKAGQLQAPCSAVQEVPEPRPTNPVPAPLLPNLSAYGLKPWALVLSRFAAYSTPRVIFVDCRSLSIEQHKFSFGQPSERNRL